MKAYGVVKVHQHAFVTSAIDGGEWSVCTSGERSSDTHWIGGWVGRRASLDAVAKRKIRTFAENRTPVVQPVA
jgi:hypothetical protein